MGNSVIWLASGGRRS